MEVAVLELLERKKEERMKKKSELNLRTIHHQYLPASLPSPARPLPPLPLPLPPLPLPLPLPFSRFSGRGERGKAAQIEEEALFPSDSNNNIMPRKAVIITTSVSELSGAPTGTWLEEVAAPYYLFQGDNLDVVIASVKGGEVPVDEKSRGEGFFTAAAKRFDADPEATRKLKESVPVADLIESLSSKDDAENQIVLVFVAGGHGIVADFADPNLTKALEAAAASGKVVVAAVCHGVAALLPVKLPDGKLLLEGRSATCFSNEEEDAVDMTKKMPKELPSLEDAVKEICGEQGYSKAGEAWGVCVVAEGKVVTGQNPGSSTGTALAALAALGAGEATEGEGKKNGGACC